MTLHFMRQGAGPCLLLLHGAFLSRAQWQPNLGALIEAGFAVIAPDLPGHGEGMGTVPVQTVESMADEIAARLDGVDPMLCVGIGLGGMVAQALALRHAARVRGLVLADPSHGVRSTAFERMETDFSNAILRLSTVEWQASLFARALTRQSPAAREYVQQQLEAHARTGQAYRAIWEAYTRFDSLPNLARMAQPTLLLMAGTHARDARHARAMQQRMPAARLATIANASHMMNMDNPAEFNTQVIGFARELFNPQTS